MHQLVNRSTLIISRWTVCMWKLVFFFRFSVNWNCTNCSGYLAIFGQHLCCTYPDFVRWSGWLGSGWRSRVALLQPPYCRLLQLRSPRQWQPVKTEITLLTHQAWLYYIQIGKQTDTNLGICVKEWRQQHKHWSALWFKREDG